MDPPPRSPIRALTQTSSLLDTFIYDAQHLVLGDLLCFSFASACCWESALGVSCFESIVDVVDGFVGDDMLNMTDMDSK